MGSEICIAAHLKALCGYVISLSQAKAISRKPISVNSINPLKLLPKSNIHGFPKNVVFRLLI